MTSGPPALTKAQAEQVLKAYAAAAGKAGKALNERALPAIQADPQLAMDTATFRLRRASRQGAPAADFSAPAFYIPRMSGYPRWFVVGAATAAGKKTERHALLFTQAKAGAPWLLAADPRPFGEALGQVALDPDGYATPVERTPKGLATLPGKLPAAHAALLSDGPRAAGASIMADGPKTNQAYDALRKAEGKFAGRGITLSTRFFPAPYQVYALRTKDRGALVWYVLKQNEAYSTATRGRLPVTGDVVGLVPVKPAKLRIDTTVLVQYLAVDPPAGRAAVVGVYRKAIAASGS